MSASDDAWATLKVVEIIRPFLAGRHPAVQSAILGELLATWLAGHPPEVRKDILSDHIDLVLGLVPLCEKAYIGETGHPGGSGKADDI
jgi:hypothetical protein